MKQFDVSPNVFSEDDFNIIMAPFIDGAIGLGMKLAAYPDENGWDQSTLFDHEVGQHLLDAAIGNLKQHAKSNQLFYNTTKLEDAAAQALVAAYGNAFVEARA